MKKQNTVGRSRKNKSSQPSGHDALMYDRLSVAVCEDVMGEATHVCRGSNSEDMPMACCKTKNAGDEDASVVGCNPNNSNASGRTLNANNALTNSNDNYAGAWAFDLENVEHISACPPRTNTTEGHVATGAHGSCDMESLPFWDLGDGTDSENNAEIVENIYLDLDKANRKRKLNDLKRFFINKRIISDAVDRCISHANKGKEKSWLEKHATEVEERIYKELNDETYRCAKPERRVIPARSKDGKPRNADIFPIYDRCIQNIVLIVLEEKLINKIPRTCYSGIKGRGLLSKDKRYCLVNRLRTMNIKYPNLFVGISDIRKFYESLQSNVVLGILFETVTCPYTRRLLANILSVLPTIPIGGTLSQLFAMLALSDLDEQMKKNFNPVFYASFGDNRIFYCRSKQEARAMISYEMSYLEGRYGMTLKDDWCIRPVKSGFRFCKYDYNNSFVHLRSVMRTRAIKGYRKGRQHFAGYQGMIEKTDSKHFYLLMEESNGMRNAKGMPVRRMCGDKVKINDLEGKELVIIDYKILDNGRESKNYVRFQCIVLDNDKSKRRLCVVNCGAQEIKGYFELVAKGDEQIKTKKLKVCREGNNYFFDGYHTTTQEAFEIICNEIDIDNL